MVRSSPWRTINGEEASGNFQAGTAQYHINADIAYPIRRYSNVQFLEREVWDLGSTPRQKFPLLLHHHPLVIYRHQVLKQADIVLAMFLLGNEFSTKQKRRNYEYYDPLTTGDSSLDDPPTLEVVLDEAALHCLVSDRRVGERQLHRLIEAVGMPNVAFQLLAYRTGPHDGMAGPFTILSFVDPADPGVVHLEHSTGEVYLDRADQVDRYRTKFRHLQALACTPDESTVFLVDLVKEL